MANVEVVILTGVLRNRSRGETGNPQRQIDVNLALDGERLERNRAMRSADQSIGTTKLKSVLPLFGFNANDGRSVPIG
jgi:hypothetical protein